MHSYGWPYSKSGGESSKVLSLCAVVLRAAVVHAAVIRQAYLEVCINWNKFGLEVAANLKVHVRVCYCIL